MDASRPLDLPSSPLQFHVPGLGDILIDAAHPDFLGRFKKIRTDDAVATFRQILITEAEALAPAPSPWAEAVDALSQPQLEAGARAFIEAAGDLFRPRLIEMGGRVRKRGPDEAYDMTPQEGEKDVVRLLRLLDAALQDRRNDKRLLPPSTLLSDADRISKIIGAANAHRGITQAMQIGRFAEAARLSALAQNQPALRLAQAALDTPGMKAAQALAMQSETRLGGLAARKAQAMLNLPELAALPAYEARLRSAGLLAAHPSNWTTGLLQGGVYRQMIEAASKASLRSSLLRDREDWLKTLNSSLHLGLSSSLLTAAAAAAAANLTASAAPPDFDLSAAYMRPGWQAAAAAAMTEQALRAPGAALLRAYEETTSSDAPVFEAALAGLHDIDASENDLAERLASRLEQLWLLFRDNTSATTDSLRKVGLAELIALMVSVATLFIAAQGATSADIEASTREIVTAIRDEAEKTRAEAAADLHSLRCVDSETGLMSAPHPESQLLRILSPHEVLRITDQKDEWLKIDVYDHRGDVISSGWVDQQRVRHIP